MAAVSFLALEGIITLYCPAIWRTTLLHFNIAIATIDIRLWLPVVTLGSIMTPASFAVLRVKTRPSLTSCHIHTVRTDQCSTKINSNHDLSVYRVRSIVLPVPSDTYFYISPDKYLLIRKLKKLPARLSWLAQIWLHPFWLLRSPFQGCFVGLQNRMYSLCLPEPYEIPDIAVITRNTTSLLCFPRTSWTSWTSIYLLLPSLSWGLPSPTFSCNFVGWAS